MRMSECADAVLMNFATDFDEKNTGNTALLNAYRLYLG